MKKYFFLCAVWLSVMLPGSFSYGFEKIRYIGQITFEKNISPADIAIDPSGSLHVADRKTGDIISYDKSGSIVSRKNPGKNFFSRFGLFSFDTKGNVLIVDSYNNKIYKFDNTFKELLAIGESGSSESQFRSPSGICIDKEDNFYVADTGNRRIQVFSFDGIFFAGIKSGERPTSTGQRVNQLKKEIGKLMSVPLTGLPYLSKPFKVSLDGKGNIYVLDAGSMTISMYDPQGAPQFSIDMAASIPREELAPLDMAVSNGKIFVLMKENIKVFDAGQGNFLNNIGSRGKGHGQFISPSAFDICDNILYILDSGNNRIQIIEYGEQKAGAAPGQKKLEDRIKVAIFDFKDTNALAKGKQLGSTVSEMFITACVNTENFVVVERKEINRILDELNFNLTDMVDVNTAKKVGKMLGIDFGIMGSVSMFGDAIEIEVRFIQLETGVIAFADSKKAANEKNLRDAVDEIVRKMEKVYVGRISGLQPPTGLFVMGDISSIFIRWDINPEAASYKVYRAYAADAEFQPAATVNNTEYQDVNVEKEKDYYYKVSAVDSAGKESKPGEPAQGKTRGRPVFGRALKVRTDVYAKKCRFSWDKPSDEEVSEYRIYKSAAESGEYKLIGSSKKTEFSDEGLDDGKTYYYRLTKVLKDSQESLQSDPFACQTDARPQAPGALKAESGQVKRITLSWNKPLIDKDIAKYNVYRCETADGEFKYLDYSRGQKFTDGKLTDYKTYYYKIQAMDHSSLLSDFSEPVSATTKNIPAVPKNLDAKSDLPRHITLTWDKNPEADIDHYSVYASTSLDKDFRKEDTSDTNSYDYKKLKDNTTYFFKITAKDKDGLVSLESETVSAKTKPLPPVPEGLTVVLVDMKASLKWTAVSCPDLAGYIIYRDGRKLTTVMEPAYTDAKLDDNENYKYEISSIDKDNLESPKSLPVEIKTPKKEK